MASASDASEWRSGADGFVLMEFVDAIERGCDGTQWQLAQPRPLGERTGDRVQFFVGFEAATVPQQLARESKAQLEPFSGAVVRSICRRYAAPLGFPEQQTQLSSVSDPRRSRHATREIPNGFA